MYRTIIHEGNNLIFFVIIFYEKLSFSQKSHLSTMIYATQPLNTVDS